MSEKKDPAFLFYSSDFLTGVADLTMEERGQFITLLCVQHQKYVLTAKTIRLSVGNVSVDVMDKFSRDEEGNYFNKRLRLEAEKRANFTQTRRNNGLKGGRPKKNEKAKENLSVNHMGNHMGNENENENRDINRVEKGIEIRKKSELQFSHYPESIRKIVEVWLNYRREIKKPILSQKSLDLWVVKLEKLSEGSLEKAAEIVATSMANQWQGIFAPNQRNAPKDGKVLIKDLTYNGQAPKTTDVWNWQ